MKNSKKFKSLRFSISSAKDIVNLQIIATEEIPPAPAKESQARSKVSVKRPIAKRAGRSVSESMPPGPQNVAGQVPVNSKKVVEPVIVKTEPSSNGKNGTEPNVKLNQKRAPQRQRWQEKDEQAFGTPIDESLNQDFDFETNLALFNKEVCKIFTKNSKVLFVLL